MSTARAAAVAVLAQVLDEGRSLTSALANALANAALAPDERSLVQELSFGVLRWFWSLEHDAHLHLTTKIRRKDRDIHRLILIGIYELRESDRPDHAVVSETVNTCVVLGKPWTKGLVNGVLRSYLRAGSSAAGENNDVQAKTDHPLWLVRYLQRAWPAQWLDIVAANNQRPPLALRVNRRQVSRRAYLAELADAAMPAAPSPLSAAGVVVEKPVPVERLPGFAAGRVSVQDIAAQLVGPLLDLAPGQRVLDACAAPGGKAGHAL
ncbi:MAG: 16S rRNA (cytosine(967)-C(5))-methyltransferase, partial [Gammaproteobacteria bacterium]|nr:16S rRNA (cytosine(967)-C(5))-methyltransferase [Gammaproteobacteria bacterium]